MTTRIKRYEERAEKWEQLLARIEQEMGPHARIERRDFTRGGFMGMFGTRMVEVIATIEIDQAKLESAPPTPSSVASSAGGEGQQGKRRIVPPPSEAKPPTSQPRRIDLRAEDTARVSMAGGGLQLDEDTPAAPQKQTAARQAPAQPKPAASKPKPAVQQTPPSPQPSALQNEVPLGREKPQTSQQSAPAQSAPAQSAPAQPVPQYVEPQAAAGNSNELSEIRASISELASTVKLLVDQQQKQLQQPRPAQPEPDAKAQEQALKDEAASQGLSDDQLKLLLEEGEPAAAEAGPAAKPAVPATGGRPKGVAANPLALDPGLELSTVQHEVYERLLDWNIGPYDALELINESLERCEDPSALDAREFEKLVVGTICRNILLSGGLQLGKTPPGRVVALIGATGVGKTTSIAKLAAKFAFQEGKRVSLVSLDNYRIAAAEQLRTYSEIMGIDLDIVFSKDEFDNQLTQRRHCDLVLIDTAGRSPINTKQIYELREVFNSHPPDEVHLVVSASTKADDLRAILENFEPLGYSHVIISKLDETRSLGAIFNVTKYCKHPISYFTVGQRVPEDIRTATLQFIQQWIEQGRVA